MARRRSRYLINQQARRKRPDAGGDPGASMRVAGFGAAFLVFIAVGAGFHGERFTQLAASGFAVLAPLAEPVLWGVSWLEFGAVLMVLAICVVTLWRGFRR